IAQVGVPLFLISLLELFNGAGGANHPDHSRLALFLALPTSFIVNTIMLRGMLPTTLLRGLLVTLCEIPIVIVIIVGVALFVYLWVGCCGPVSFSFRFQLEM